MIGREKGRHENKHTCGFMWFTPEGEKSKKHTCAKKAGHYGLHRCKCGRKHGNLGEDMNDYIGRHRGNGEGTINCGYVWHTTTIAGVETGAKRKHVCTIRVSKNKRRHSGKHMCECGETK